MKKVAIFGAGVVGITTAWYLRKSGWAVDVYDRQSAPGLETSFANGGQISVSHAEPWAGPGVPMKALGWMLQEDSPLLFRPRLDPRQWRWGLKFLSHCNHDAWVKNTKNLIALGLYSRQELQALRAQLKLEYGQTTQGIIHGYTDATAFSHAMETAKLMESWGVDRQILSKSEAIALEPSLATVPGLMGATYTRSDETGDAYVFTSRLYEHCLKEGVRFHFNYTFKRLNMIGQQVTNSSRNTQRVLHAELQDKDHRIELAVADAYVVAMGSFSPLAVPRPALQDIYPAKGYSATFKRKQNGTLPVMSITDEANKVVFTPIGKTLRVAGTAEFNGYSTELNPVRCAALLAATRRWFGYDMVDFTQADYWSGLRPATPNNTPIIGVDPEVSNLFFNTGHGTLGWTHACGSAKGLTRLMNKENAECAFQFLC